MKTYELGFYNGNPQPFAKAEVTFTFAGDKVIGVSCTDTPAEIPNLCDQLLGMLGGQELLFNGWLCSLTSDINVKVIREVTTPTTQPEVEATTKPRDLRLEVGKSYKARNGIVFEIIGDNGANALFHLVGVNTITGPVTFAPNGRHAHLCSQLDLIEEITTPTTQPEVEGATTSVEDSSQTDSATAGVRNIEPFDAPAADEPEYTGGSVSYYTVNITNPTTEGREPYEAECNDIIEALGMTYAEGNAFKAIWRRCAARTLGKAKAGYKDGLYDAEKVVFFGGRMVAKEKGATE